MSVRYNLKKISICFISIGHINQADPAAGALVGKGLWCWAGSCPEGTAITWLQTAHTAPAQEQPPGSIRSFLKVGGLKDTLHSHQVFQAAVPHLFQQSPSSCYINDNSLIKNQTVSSSRAGLCGVHSSPPWTYPRATPSLPFPPAPVKTTCE